jgi:hypothetical protein
VAERPVVLPPIRREMVVSHIYSRYNSLEFERRWQMRLNVTARPPASGNSRLCVVVTHRFPTPNRYGWEFRPEGGLPVEESRVHFTSWEEASQAGKMALKQLSEES